MKTQDLVKVAIMAAMIAVGAFIKIPAPVVGSFTLQLTFVILAGLLLGKKNGALAAGVYAIGGVVGIPWFTMGGGIGYVFQPTFGFILSFILGAYIAGFFREKAEERSRLKGKSELSVPLVMVGAFLATIEVWVLGMLYLAMIYQVVLGKAFSYKMALISIFSPSFVADMTLAVVVTLVGLKIYKGISRTERVSA